MSHSIESGGKCDYRLRQRCVMGHGTGTEHRCATPMSKDELLAEIHAALSRFLK